MKRLAILIGILVFVGAGYAQTPKPAKIEHTIKKTVVVTNLDVASRHLTIKTQKGDEFTVDVDPEVRNLAQLKVGDKIVVTYYEGLAASLKKPGEAKPETAKVETTRAEPGALPGGKARVTQSVTVTVDSVDTKKNVVSFHGPDKLVRTADIVRPEGKAFIKELKKGDEVVITYTESLAVHVEPAK
jgi:hypothetical protein